MKLRNIILAAGAVLMLAVACDKSSKKTVISGSIPSDYLFIDTLHVYFEDSLLVSAPVDTISGAYKIEIPADVTKLAIVATPYFQIPFVSDGTALKLSITDEEEPKLVAAKEGETGLTDRMNNYMKAVSDIQESVMTVMRDYEDSDITEDGFMAIADSLFEPQYKQLKELNINTIRQNPDNIIAVYALMSSDIDDDFPALLKDLSPEIKARDDIKALLAQLESVGATSVGAHFLDFEASLDCNDLAGTKVHLSDYVGRGKFILLDFWASWCAPCRAEVPYIKTAYEKHVGENFDVVSVALNDDPDDSAIAAVDLGIIWNSLVGAGSRPGELYGITAIPHLILIGPEGTILARGFRGEEIEATIARFVK